MYAYIRIKDNFKVIPWRWCLSICFQLKRVQFCDSNKMYLRISDVQCTVCFIRVLYPHWLMNCQTKCQHIEDCCLWAYVTPSIKSLPNSPVLFLSFFFNFQILIVPKFIYMCRLCASQFASYKVWYVRPTYSISWDLVR